MIASRKFTSVIKIHNHQIQVLIHQRVQILRFLTQIQERRQLMEKLTDLLVGVLMEQERAQTKDKF